MSAIINPYKGIVFDDKEITFGMSQQDVKNVLGEAPQIEIDNIMEEIREQRFGMTFVYENEQLVSIDVSLHVKLFYRDIDIFNSEDAIAQLSKYDTPTSDNCHYMNFYKLGICMGGFGKKKIPEKKLVTIFSKNKRTFYERMLHA